MGAGASSPPGTERVRLGEGDKMTKEETVAFAKDMNLRESTDWAKQGEHVTWVQGEGGGAAEMEGEKMYQSFKGVDGLVSRLAVRSVTKDSMELETYAVFTEYCGGDGVLMDQTAFLHLLKDARLLSRGDLPQHYATMIFREHSWKLDPPKRLNFTYFREEMVPILAGKKSLQEKELLSRFCHIEVRKHAKEAAVELEEREADLKVGGQRADSFGDKSKGVADSHLSSPSTPAENSAACTLQTLTRRLSADRQISFMRQCSRTREDPTVAVAAVVEPPKTKESDKLLRLFTRYAESFSSNYDFVRSLISKGQIERKQLVAMCQDAGFIKRSSFTANDCNQVFDEAVAIAMNPASDPRYKADIFFDKRLGFLVFRDMFIPGLARRTQMEQPAAVALLLVIPQSSIRVSNTCA